jgi:Type II restriction endonuclease EcoO109I
MSGPQNPNISASSPSDDDAVVVANVRRLSGVPAGSGPDNVHILAAVRGFVDRFDFWYVRVMRGAVAKYRELVIKRINPFIRRIDCDGLTAAQTASKLVEDYNARNFVTAGGWALEALAVRVTQHGQKSATTGIDLQRVDPATGDYHLYVLKSGLVTRNSDILAALKRNARQAEKLLRQDGQHTNVHAHYAIVAGKTESSFDDGINRPSSAEFWSHMTELPERQALDLVLSIAAVAGQLVRRDVSEHLEAMKIVVADYIADHVNPEAVDWVFLALRNMEAPSVWAAEDKDRHRRAIGVLAATGYVPAKKKAAPGKRKG